ncbi:hypothetical protein CY34DRAFT_813647, partial [Suillus luteus UH-Slu-Lm8-n1]
MFQKLEPLLPSAAPSQLTSIKFRNHRLRGQQQSILAVEVKSELNLLLPGCAAEAPRHHMITYQHTI